MRGLPPIGLGVTGLQRHRSSAFSAQRSIPKFLSSSPLASGAAVLPLQSARDWSRADAGGPWGVCTQRRFLSLHAWCTSVGGLAVSCEYKSCPVKGGDQPCPCHSTDSAPNVPSGLPASKLLWDFPSVLPRPRGDTQHCPDLNLKTLRLRSFSS